MSKKSRALLMLMTPQDDGVGGPGVVPWDIDKNRKFKCACGHTVELPLDMLRYRERLDESTGEIIKEVSTATPDAQAVSARTTNSSRSATGTG
jgi:hypothetical protein